MSKMAASRKLAARGSIPVTGDLNLTPVQKQLVLGTATSPVASGPAFTVPGLDGVAAKVALPAAAIPTIATQADYDAIPVGSPYIDSETGQQHIKGQ